MEVDTVTQTDLRCRVCGGQGHFDPAQGALVCDSCGTPRDLSHPDDEDARVEHPYDPDQPCTEARVDDGVHVHACTACGGELVFTGHGLSDQCPYCNGAVVRGPEDTAYRTMALIPFAVTEKAAQRRAQGWVERRLAAPSDLKPAVAKGRVAGLYAPFWTFDSEEAIQYWARYTTGSGKNRRTRSVKGDMRVHFNDLIVPASPHVTGLIRDGILHDFDPWELRSFQPGYLAGFAAERHHQSVSDGLRSNEEDKDLLIRNRIRRHINRSGVHNIGYRTDTTGIHYRRILLPVWILHYDYGDKAYKVVVSGIDGRTFGERPFSNVKLAAYAALGTVLAMAIGLVWGAVGLL